MNDFNWVDALSSCALSTAFESLKIQTQEDVKVRNAQLSRVKAGYEYVFEGHGDNFFVAAAGHGISGMAVKARLAASEIQVINTDDKMKFTATLTLNDIGECKLFFDGQEREYWHFRKRAFAELLFTSPYGRG